MSVTETTTTRTFEGVEIPTAGRYVLDVTHTTVGFVAKHLVVAKTRGRFGEFDGAITIADEPLSSTVEVTIQAASIDSRTEDRDAHLRSPDFLDVEQFPTLSFRSTGVRHQGGNKFLVDGELNIKGVTNPVVLDMELDGVMGDPWGGQRVAFTASTQIDREAFGLTWNVALETGGVMVGKQVKIEIEGEAVREV